MTSRELVQYRGIEQPCRMTIMRITTVTNYGSYDQGMDCNDIGAFGPLEPSESERTLMERVREELKEELKQGYTSKIADDREEILRKRRAGKLPEGTTDILKNWWDAHAKWPYPTEEEKDILIQRTGFSPHSADFAA